MKQLLQISCVLFFSFFTVSCGTKLVTDSLAPLARNTSESVDSDSSDALYCGVHTGGTNPRIPASNQVLVGYKHYYDPGTQPAPCWWWSSAAYRGAFRFDLTNYMGKKIVSAILTLRLDQAEYSSGSVASNEGVWLKSIGLGTSEWWEKPSPHIVGKQADLFPFKKIPGMPDLPYGMSPAAQPDFPVKYNGLNTYTIEVSAVVRNWLDGTEPNMGFILLGPNESTVSKTNSTALSPVNQITLDITYSVPK